MKLWQIRKKRRKKKEASLEAWGKSLISTGLSVFPGLSERIPLAGLLECTSSLYRSCEHVVPANANHRRCIMYRPCKALEMELLFGGYFVTEGYSLKLKAISCDSGCSVGMEFLCGVLRGFSKGKAWTPLSSPPPFTPQPLFTPLSAKYTRPREVLWKAPEQKASYKCIHSIGHKCSFWQSFVLEGPKL